MTPTATTAKDPAMTTAPASGMTAADHPAAWGEPVQERHARACRETGHVAWTSDGVDVGRCARCGEVTLSAAESAALALFDAGVPVTIEDPDLRETLSAHRFGRHHDRPEAAARRSACPACRRGVAARIAVAEPSDAALAALLLERAESGTFERGEEQALRLAASILRLPTRVSR